MSFFRAELTLHLFLLDLFPLVAPCSLETSCSISLLTSLPPLAVSLVSFIIFPLLPCMSGVSLPDDGGGGATAGEVARWCVR